jgi:hypothetical protein
MLTKNEDFIKLKYHISNFVINDQPIWLSKIKKISFLKLIDVTEKQQIIKIFKIKMN